MLVGPLQLCIISDSVITVVTLLPASSCRHGGNMQGRLQVRLATTELAVWQVKRYLVPQRMWFIAVTPN